jgi:hypothetical protein
MMSGSGATATEVVVPYRHRASFKTATEHYRPGALGGPAKGYGIKLERTEGRHVARGGAADDPGR